MLPAVTNCPPKRFTPSIWGLESRPFRELPTPFLCAMRLDLDLGDAHRGHGLPMPAVTPVVLPPLELHHEDLGALRSATTSPVTLAEASAFGSTVTCPSLVDQEDLGELHRGALVLGPAAPP